MISASNCATTSASRRCCGAATTYPHSEATFPRSQQFLARMFDGVPEADLRKITSENAAKLFQLELN
jgi:hypothetical protein